MARNESQGGALVVAVGECLVEGAGSAVGVYSLLIVFVWGVSGALPLWRSAQLS